MEIRALRRALALHGGCRRLGAERAKAMSDSELMATGVRVRWKLTQHVAPGESLVDADWIRALAEAIARGETAAAEPRSAVDDG
jgi:ribonuclease HI